jgi:hypothetical protein
LVRFVAPRTKPASLKKRFMALGIADRLRKATRAISAFDD